QQQRMRYLQFHDTMSSLSSDIALSYIRVQQIQHEFDSQQQALQLQTHELALLKNMAQEVENYMYQTRIVQDFCMREVLSLEHHSEHRHIISFNGILKWKISDVQEKISTYIQKKKRIFLLLNLFSILR